MVKDTAAANDRAVDLLRIDVPSTVLDIGFGQGRTVAKLLAEGHRVIGVDSSPTMVAQAIARNRRACADGSAQLVQSDGITLPFPDASADAAYCVHAIYFMTDPGETISEIARVLRPSGRFVIACRVGDDPKPRWMDSEVYQIPTIVEITAMFDRAGFVELAHIAGATGTQSTHWFVGAIAS